LYPVGLKLSGRKKSKEEKVVSFQDLCAGKQ
jgi:hypothetical protein